MKRSFPLKRNEVKTDLRSSAGFFIAKFRKKFGNVFPETDGHQISEIKHFIVEYSRNLRGKPTYAVVEITGNTAQTVRLFLRK